MNPYKNPYKPFSNYILRTPLLTFNFYKDLTSENNIAITALKEVYGNPIIKEAIFLASPHLFFELEKWNTGKLDSKKEKRIIFSLLKYLTRMSTRCTPFGLFAGCSVGTISDRTSIINNAPDQNTRHTRLDMNYLVALGQDLSKKKEIRSQLRYYPNSSIYVSGEQLRYIEYTYVNSKREHHVIEVDNSMYLQDIIETAKDGVLLSDLVSLLTTDVSISEEEATNFIDELVDSQILISELEPAVSGPEFMDQLLYVLQSKDKRIPEIQLLQETAKQLATIDTQIGNPPKVYLNLSEHLKKSITTFELKYLFQSDLELKPRKNTLASTVVTKLQNVMVLLNRITLVPKDTNLTAFRKAFYERYEEREMSLAAVLDVETGIGYLQNNLNGDINPLIDDLFLPEDKNSLATKSFDHTAIHDILHKKLIESDSTGAKKIVLTDSEFENFPANWSDLPDTFSAMIALIKEGDSEKIKLLSLGGSSAVNLLGRFCHGDKKLYQYARQITDMEEAMNADALLAEIVHLPESRVGNILMHPALRNYEIPYLAKSLASSKHQIPLDDLYISIRNNTLILRSKKLNKRIIPRLSNAHNFSFNALPIYQFLCDLQASEIRGGFHFSYGYLEQGRTFLPRVEYENFIIKEASWVIHQEDVQPLLDTIDNTEALKIALATFVTQFKLPQYVFLSDGDNELLVNFLNITSVQMLLDTIKKRKNFLLVEFLFSDEGIVQSKQGYYTNQIILSFYNEEKIKAQNEKENTA